VESGWVVAGADAVGAHATVAGRKSEASAASGVAGARREADHGRGWLPPQILQMTLRRRGPGDTFGLSPLARAEARVSFVRRRVDARGGNKQQFTDGQRPSCDMSVAEPSSEDRYSPANGSSHGLDARPT
jgi:hypothetical protein